MNILALETSTTSCSAAIVREDRVLADAEWVDSAADHQRLFRALPALFAASGVQPHDIGCFAVDTGPGRFTGLRMAVATAHGMALPAKTPVIGIDSGSVMAWQTWRGGTAGRVVVAGDSRRGRLWMARFEDGKTGPRVLTPYTSVQAAEATSVLERGDVIVSPDWVSLAGLLSEAATSVGAVPVSAPCVPKAEVVGLLASLRLAAGEEPSAAIVYLHPPV